MIKLSDLLESIMQLPFEVKSKGVGDFYVQADGSNAGKPFLERPVGGNYHAVTTDKAKLDPKYFYYVVLTMYNSKMIQQYVHGTTVPHLTIPNFKRAVVDFFNKNFR
jgi:hypothetical protein